MEIFVRSRERDHRDYEFVVTEDEEAKNWLTNYHRYYPSHNIGFVYQGIYGMFHEFDVYKINDNKSVIRLSNYTSVMVNDQFRDNFYEWRIEVREQKNAVGR